MAGVHGSGLRAYCKSFAENVVRETAGILHRKDIMRLDNVLRYPFELTLNLHDL